MESSMGRYQLLERIGGGGMADVYRALALGPAGFRKIVAIKIIRPAMCADPEFVRMFQREASIAARIGHPNAVQVFEFNRDRNQHYLVMEFVEGLDLKTLLERCGGPLPPALAFFIASKVLAALHHAHTLCDESGRCLRIIHRDVTPHNILLSINGDVKLADFGIARTQDGIGLTNANMVRGKLPYLSPEQARGEPLDPRTDLYSLGLVLFEMLTGVRRFCQRGAGGMAEVLEGRYLPPSHLEPGLDGLADRLTGRLCAPGRENRFPSAQAARRAIEAHFSWDASAVLGQWVSAHMRTPAASEACTQLLARDEDSASFTFGEGDRPTAKLDMLETCPMPAADEVETRVETGPEKSSCDQAPAPPAAPLRPHAGIRRIHISPLFLWALLFPGLGLAGLSAGYAAVFLVPGVSAGIRPSFQRFSILHAKTTIFLPKNDPVEARPEKQESSRFVKEESPGAPSRERAAAAPLARPKMAPPPSRRTRVVAPSAAVSDSMEPDSPLAPSPKPHPAAPAASPKPHPTAPAASIDELKSDPDWE